MGSNAIMEIVTPANPGAHIRYGAVRGGRRGPVLFNQTQFLDTGACPGPDPGFAGMSAPGGGFSILKNSLEMRKK